MNISEQFLFHQKRFSPFLFRLFFSSFPQNVSFLKKVDRLSQHVRSEPGSIFSLSRRNGIFRTSDHNEFHNIFSKKFYVYLFVVESLFFSKVYYTLFLDLLSPLPELFLFLIAKPQSSFVHTSIRESRIYHRKTLDGHFYVSLVSPKFSQLIQRNFFEFLNFRFDRLCTLSIYNIFQRRSQVT